VVSRNACATDKPAKEAPRTTMLRDWFMALESLVVSEAVREWPLGGGLIAGKMLLSPAWDAAFAVRSAFPE
jgi:hypothetical protein